MWSDLTLGPSFKGQTRIAKLKLLITRLLLILEVYNAKLTHTKSWARNLLMLYLTFGPSFKVKQWFTGFGELSFRWIQICIGSPMRRSSYCLMNTVSSKLAFIMSTHWGLDVLFLLFPASGVPLGFQTFSATVLILSLPNLACRFIGLIACLGLLLVMIAL